jgi:hypothetical protein
MCVSQQANALVNSLIGESRISTLGLVVVDEVIRLQNLFYNPAVF